MSTDASATPQPETPDVTCEHGTAMDVHCCHCHSGFIFDMNHECPPLPRGWREALEDALGLEPDAENHTPEWAFETVRAIREIGNAAAPPPDVERLTRDYKRLRDAAERLNILRSWKRPMPSSAACAVKAAGGRG